MTGSPTDLTTVALFEGLTPEDLAAVSAIAEAREWQEGEEIYSLGEPGGSMFVVLEGAVEIFSIVSGIEKLFLTVRDGGAFDLLSILDRGTRLGNARALETTRGLELEGARVQGLFEERPELGIKILGAIGRTLGQRTRLLTEQYKATLAWNLEASGLTSLNLERLMTDGIEVTVEALRGEPVTGTLLRFEASAAGHELYVEGRDRRIHVIPYHAVVRVSAHRDDVEDSQDDPAL